MSKSVTRTIWIGTDKDDETQTVSLAMMRDDPAGFFYRTENTVAIFRGIPPWYLRDGLDLPPPGEQRQYTITITPVEG